MKKETTRIFALIILGLFMFSFLAGVVSAQDSAWERWKEGILSDLDAKILAFLIILSLIIVLLSMAGAKVGLSVLLSIPASIFLTWAITPLQIIGIFKGTSTATLTILTVAPLLIFFLLTYVSVAKFNRVLMGLQLLIWGIFLIYSLLRVGLYSYILSDGTWLDWLFKKFEFNITGLDLQVLYYALVSSIICVVVSFIMTVWNGFFLNFAAKRIIGIDEAKFQDILSKTERGKKLLMEMGSTEERGR